MFHKVEKTSTQPPPNSVSNAAQIREATPSFASLTAINRDSGTVRQSGRLPEKNGIGQSLSTSCTVPSVRTVSKLSARTSLRQEVCFLKSRQGRYRDQPMFQLLQSTKQEGNPRALCASSSRCSADSGRRFLQASKLCVANQSFAGGSTPIYFRQGPQPCHTRSRKQSRVTNSENKPQPNGRTEMQCFKQQTAEDSKGTVRQQIHQASTPVPLRPPSTWP